MKRNINKTVKKWLGSSSYSDSMRKMESRKERKLPSIESIRSTRRGLYWWVGGVVRDKRGNLHDALVRAENENDAYQIAYNKFEPSPEPDIFTTTTGDTTEANQEYRMRRVKTRKMNLGDTLARVRHKGDDLDL